MALNLIRRLIKGAPLTAQDHDSNLDVLESAIEAVADGTVQEGDSPTFADATVEGLLTANHIHGNLAGSVYLHVKNTSGGTLAKGTPVRVIGAVGDTTILQVAAANASSEATMPAIAILDAALANNAEGHAVLVGEVTGLNTGAYALGQTLFVAAGGGLTGTRPTANAQAVAVVGRVHASTGTIAVSIDAVLPAGAVGADGASAYEVAVANGFAGTEAQWLASLQGPAGPAGADGQDGAPGADGLSAYQVAVAAGFSGTESEWLASLQGAPGADGADGQDGTGFVIKGTVPTEADLVGIPSPAVGEAYQVVATGDIHVWSGTAWVNLGPIQGPAGPAGADGSDGAPGADGSDGLSAYQIAVAAGFSGTESEWLASLQGADGAPGADGTDGASAYEIAVAAGFSGTQTEWLASLQGADGAPGADGADGTDGASAYELAVAAGFAGTESEWLASLQGADADLGAIPSSSVDYTGNGFLSGLDAAYFGQGYKSPAPVSFLNEAGNAGITFHSVDIQRAVVGLPTLGGGFSIFSQSPGEPYNRAFINFLPTYGAIGVNGSLDFQLTSDDGQTAAQNIFGFDPNGDFYISAGNAAAFYNKPGGTPGQVFTKTSGNDYDADWATLSTADIYVIACSDETTALTTGTGKVTFRMPSAGTLTAVKATLTTAAAVSALIVDIKEAGTSVLSTKLSIDIGEKTSATAATPAVISDSALANDAEITIDIVQVGTAAGLKVYLYVTRG
jgi:hypothetical protein